MLAPPVHFSQTAPAWPDPILVPEDRARPSGVPDQRADSIGEAPRAGARELPGRDARDESFGPVVSRRRELAVQ